MQSMTRILHEDAEAIQLTEAELNESFIKLQRLVQFQENTKYTKRNDGMRTPACSSSHRCSLDYRNFYSLKV